MPKDFYGIADTETRLRKRYLDIALNAEVKELFFKKAKSEPVSEIVEDFKKTGLYSKLFLRDLKDGLEKSSRAKK